MKVIDLTKTLAAYTSGWVAINKKNEVIAHAATFEAICQKIRKTKGILLVPASKNYFGFITFANA